MRTAGARHVLVTLKPVGDRGAAACMPHFHHHWLGQAGRSDPTAALGAAQVEPMSAPAKDGSGGADQTWAQFVLIGG